MRHGDYSVSSKRLKKHYRWSLIGPYLVLFVGFVVRGMNIGALPPYIDEAANILTGIDREIQFSISPETLGRPLLAWLFFPALVIRDQLFPKLHLLDISRWFGSVAVFFAGGLVVAVAFRTGGRIAAWVVAVLWAASPFIFLHGRLALQDPFSALFLAIILGCIALRPEPSEQRSRWAEKWCWVIVGITSFLLLLNKITAVLEVPWVVAFYGVERRRGGQPLVTKARKNPFVFLSVSLLLIAFLSMGFFSLQRLSRFGYVSQTSVRTNLLVRWSDGLFNLQYYLREYFGIPFCLIVLASLLLLPRLSPQRALFVLGYVGYQFILTLVYGNSFFARYLFGGFVPLSLLVGWVAASCGEAEGDRRLKGSAALFVAAWTVLSWSKSIASVIANPVHNAFSPSGGGAWPTRDYELYTIGAASGVGTAKLVDTIKWEQAKSPGSPVTVLGSDNFSPTGLSMRLLFFDDPQVRVLEGWSNRWDLPFSLASIWSSSPDEGSGSRMFLIATVYCESLYPTPCDEVAPQIPGAQLQLVREIGRADPHSRFQLFELKALYEEELEKLSPPDDGRYPDGLVAPTLFVSLPSESRGERWSLSGKVLAGTALRPEKIKMWEDEREISFTVQQAGELFTIIPQQPFRGSRLRIFFGNWQMQFDPFDHTTNYRNRQRAVSARDVKLVMQVR